MVVHSFPLCYCLHSAPLPPLFLLLPRQDILLSKMHIMLSINGLYFPPEKRKTRGKLAGSPSIPLLGGPGLSGLSDCPHPKPESLRKSGKSFKKSLRAEKSPLFSFSLFK